MADRPALVLSLAHPRAPWARRVTAWATSGVIPLRHQPCLTVREVDRRLRDEPVTAVLAEHHLAGADGDLVALARRAGVVVLTVAPDDDAPRGAEGSGPTLASDFGPADLLAVLPDAAPVCDPAPPPEPTVTAPTGSLVVVTGVPGSGVSTVAALLAAGAHRRAPSALLLELTTHGDQAVRHGLADAHPGLAGCLTGDATHPARVHAASHATASGHHLLPGLPAGHRADLEPGPVAAVVRACRARFATVVAECDADLLPTLAAHHDGGAVPPKVLLVTRPDAMSVHRLVALVRRLPPADGRPPTVVLNAPAGPLRPLRPAAEALHRLVAPAADGGAIVLSRHRPGLEGRIRDGRPLRSTRRALGLDRVVPVPA